MDRILPLQLARGGHQGAFLARNRILPHFSSAGGEASADERGGHQGEEKDRILPLRLARGGGAHAFSVRDRILPCFCSLGGEASEAETKAPTRRA